MCFCLLFLAHVPFIISGSPRCAFHIVSPKKKLLIQWVDLRDHLQETIDFHIKNMGYVPVILSLKNQSIDSCSEHIPQPPPPRSWFLSTSGRDPKPPHLSPRPRPPLPPSWARRRSGMRTAPLNGPLGGNWR